MAVFPANHMSTIGRQIYIYIYTTFHSIPKGPVRPAGFCRLAYQPLLEEWARYSLKKDQDRTQENGGQGPCSKPSSGGGGGGLKKNGWRKTFRGGGGGGGGGHACGFLFNFSKVTENANNAKTIDFFPHLQWCCYRVWKFTITKLKYHRLLCYTTDINL